MRLAFVKFGHVFPGQAEEETPMIMALYRLRSKWLYRIFLKARQWCLRFFDPVVTVHIKKRSVKAYLSSTFPITFRRFPAYDSVLIRVCHFIAPQQDHRLRIIDVGANIGDTFALLDQETDAEFLCIEGNPDFYSLLARNTRRHGNVFPVQAYLGEPGREVEMAFQRQQHGTCYLDTEKRPGISPKDPVHVVPLDQLLAHYPLFQKAQILKIDTDGYDYKIIRGATHFIANTAPVIFFECCPPYLLQQKEDPLAIFALLRSLGYGRAIFYDHMGFPIIELATDAKKQIDSLINYSLIADNIFFDVLLFPQDFGQGFFDCEMAVFPMLHPLVRGLPYPQWLSSNSPR